jgi:acyl-CoA synthetase (NDP forming)
LLADENVDGVLLSLASGPGGQYAVSRENMEEMADIALRQRKPLVINLLGSEEFTAGLVQTAEERGIPVFSAPEESVNALGGLWRYYQFSSHQMGTTSGAW